MEEKIDDESKNGIQLNQWKIIEWQLRERLSRSKCWIPIFMLVYIDLHKGH
jgi:hypothetical protein